MHSFPPLYSPQSVGELLTKPILGKLMLGFTTGLEAIPVALEDRVDRYDLFSERTKYWARFCTELRGPCGCDEACREWDKKVALILLGDRPEDYPGQHDELSRPFECHAHMLDVAQPILLAGRPFAVLHGGQIRPTDAGWQERMQRRLSAILPVHPERVTALLRLASDDPKVSLAPEAIQARDAQFRQFAAEIEELLNKLYCERRRASQEVLLKSVVEVLAAAAVTDWTGWWSAVSEVLAGLRQACRVDRMAFFMGSPGRRFELSLRASAPLGAYGGGPVRVGSQWEALRHKPVRLTTQSWAAQFRRDLAIDTGTACIVAATTCRWYEPRQNLPAVFVAAGGGTADRGMRSFCSDLASEIGRMTGVTARAMEVERVRKAAAEFGAFGAHGVKFKLHAAINQAHAIDHALTRHNIHAQDIVDPMRALQRSLDAVCSKAAELEAVPVSEMCVQCDLALGDILPLLERTIDMAGMIEADRGISVVRRSWPSAPVMLLLDEHQLEYAVEAVFENAVKYSLELKEVRAFADCTERSFVLRISNFGIGIPPAKLLDVFEFGGRAAIEDSYHDRDRRGAGLGLPIARRIVEAHNGTLEIESKPPRGISVEDDDYRHHEVTVTLTLPLAGAT